MELSEEKTLITHIDDGFDFLGFNIRKYKGVLLIKPSEKALKKFAKATHEIIYSMRSRKQAEHDAERQEGERVHAGTHHPCRHATAALHEGKG